MRSAIVFVGGILLLAATPTAGHAGWPYHQHHHFPPYKMPVVPIAAPIQFQLPFGFGVNVSGLSVQGPLGNRVEIGTRDRARRSRHRLRFRGEQGARSAN